LKADIFQSSISMKEIQKACCL